MKKLEMSNLLLNDETDIIEEDIKIRKYIILQLIYLPDEVFTRLQYLQPQIGCFNRCTFCSQFAGSYVWQFTEKGLRNLIAAIAHVLERKFGRRKYILGNARISHRPGVIFPYLDNDILSYPFLDEYIKLLFENLGTQVRLSTVGYSSKSQRLQKMHEKISRNMSNAVSGIRFSFTPYTIGWSKHDSVNHQQYLRDFSNAIGTYRIFMETLGFGQKTACIELRFAPLVHITKVEEKYVNSYHVVRAGPHMLVRRIQGFNILDVAKVKEIKNGVPILDKSETNYFLYSSDQDISDTHWESFAERVIKDGFPLELGGKEVDVYKLSNRDGIYYAIQPYFNCEGSFEAMQFYPTTEIRRISGYVDSTRFFLNNLLSYKRKKGIKRREPFLSAKYSDVLNMLEDFSNHGKELRKFNRIAADHIDSEILPLVESCITVIREAGFPPASIFDPFFLIDTGQVVNQGRARKIFKGLVTLEDEPMTPREERGYGKVSISSARGLVWRIAPKPFLNQLSHSSLSIIGGKNEMSIEMSLQIEELSYHNLRPYDNQTGETLRKYIIEGVESELIKLDMGTQMFLYPGVV